jgi:predicted RNA binding protein YcfA (HicA-like mRNA interferase family)
VAHSQIGPVFNFWGTHWGPPRVGVRPHLVDGYEKTASSLFETYTGREYGWGWSSLMSSSSLPIISGAECVAALAQFGYVQTRQRGSHVRLNCEGRAPVTVPLHSELDRGTLRAILRTAEIDSAAFVAACGS